MPVVGHRPSGVVDGSGEICVALSEPAQRIRGSLTLREPGADRPCFLCRETPRRRERLAWLFRSVQDGIPREPTLTPILVRETPERVGASPQTLHYLRDVQALEMTYSPISEEFNLFFIWNLYTPPAKGPPTTSEQSQVDLFLSSYKELPISWTLSLADFEPHKKQRDEVDPRFPGAVGDPPLDPGGAWPGIYNGFDPAKLLSVGGTSWAKGYDPFQESDAHASLPPSPGLISASLVASEGGLVDLGAVAGSLNDDTAHLYFQREIQSSRMATSVLMGARGFLYDLEGEERTPDPDDSDAVEGPLRIGSSRLSAALRDEPYVGLNKITIEDVSAIFPFGVTLPGFVSLIPGEQGHQFHVSGGQEPYLWCLRSTRSSATDPAHFPLIPGSPPSPPSPYPFDSHGDLIDPEPDFPAAVAGGGLPPGMLLDQGGLLYGTPTQSGTFLFRLHVKDVNGLRGEATLRLVVRDQETDVPLCSTPRGEFPAIYKTTLTAIDIPPLMTVDQVDGWAGRIQAVGGQTGDYTFVVPLLRDPPRQGVPAIGSTPLLGLGVRNGTLALTGLDSQNFSQAVGVWVFEIRATEITPVGIIDPAATCDLRAVCVTIGTSRVAGVDDSGGGSGGARSIPEGNYRQKIPGRSYLILETPRVVTAFPHGKNLYLRGNVGYPLRPDLGGLNLNPGPVTSLHPGVVNPVQVIGIQTDSLSPSHTYLDWTNSNPTDYFRDIYDRFDPVPSQSSPPTPPGSSGSNPIQGDQIDDMIPVGKRIRPLWPV